MNLAPPLRRSRVLAATAAAVAVVAAGLVAAPAASATAHSYTVDCSNGGLVDVVNPPLAVGDTITFTTSDSNCGYWYSGGALPDTPTVTGPITITSTGTGDYNVNWTGSGTATLTVSVPTAGSGGAYFAFARLGDSSNFAHGTNLRASSVSAAPAPAPEAGDSAPASVVADFSLGGGAEGCTDGATSGVTGQWMTLPSMCSAPAGHAGAALLGWSTSADFPVAIAQRQSDNKWGTYELTDAEGRVTAVFIPAGWGTFVSGANTLYPVWSK